MPPSLKIDSEKQSHMQAESGDETQVGVSVVLPAFNEEAAIGRVIDDVRRAMESSGHRYEILVVDDHSEDRTAEVAELHEVRVVRRSMRGGSGASRRTGIRQAR